MDDFSPERDLELSNSGTGEIRNDPRYSSICVVARNVCEGLRPCNANRDVKDDAEAKQPAVKSSVLQMLARTRNGKQRTPELSVSV